MSDRRSRNARSVTFVVSAFVSSTLLMAQPAPAVNRAEVRIIRCDAVLAFIPVPIANLDNLPAEHRIPAEFKDDALDPVPSIEQDQAEIRISAEDCNVDVSGPVLWGEARLTLDDDVNARADGQECLENDPACAKGEAGWYGLSLATENPHYSGWAKAGTALDGYIALSKDVRFSRSGNVDGIEHVDFESPAPEEWSFEMSADVRWPRGEEPLLPLSGSVWRKTGAGTARFSFSPVLPGNIKFGPASGRITIPPGTVLADLLKGGDGCNETGTFCEFVGLSAIDEQERFVKTVVPR